MRAYGEVGVPKDTPGRTVQRPGDPPTKTWNEHYAVYGWVHEATKVYRVLIATTHGKDQARAVIDDWNRTHTSPGQTKSTYANDIETVRHYKYGEKVLPRD